MGDPQLGSHQASQGAHKRDRGPIQRCGQCSWRFWEMPQQAQNQNRKANGGMVQRSKAQVKNLED